MDEPPIDRARLHRKYFEGVDNICEPFGKSNRRTIDRLFTRQCLRVDHNGCLSVLSSRPDTIGARVTQDLALGPRRPIRGAQAPMKSLCLIFTAAVARPLPSVRVASRHAGLLWIVAVLATEAPPREIEFEIGDEPAEVREILA